MPPKQKGTDFLSENSEIERTLRRVNVIRGYECNSLAGETRAGMEQEVEKILGDQETCDVCLEMKRRQR